MFQYIIQVMSCAGTYISQFSAVSWFWTSMEITNCHILFHYMVPSKGWHIQTTWLPFGLERFRLPKATSISPHFAIRYNIYPYIKDALNLLANKLRLSYNSDRLSKVEPTIKKLIIVFREEKKITSTALVSGVQCVFSLAEINLTKTNSYQFWF